MRHIRRNSAAQKWLDRHACLIFLAPAFFFYTLFWIVPMLGAFIISFSRWNGNGFDGIKWVGTANYSNLINDRFFWTSLENNLIFVGGALVFIVGISLVVALILNAKPRFHAFFATAFFFPIVLSSVVIGLLFTLFLSPTTGIVNGMADFFGLASLKDVQ